MAQVVVRVDVAGDPKAGPELYWVTLDGYWWTAIEPATDAALSLSQGVHAVEIGFRANSADLWCAAEGQTSQQMTFRKDRASFLHFNVTCPSLTGTGTIDVSTLISGRTQPSKMSARLRRLNGPALQDSFDIDIKGVTERTMAPGVYSVDLYTKGCTGTSTFHTIVKEPVIVRDKVSLPVQLKMACPLPLFP